MCSDDLNLLTFILIRCSDANIVLDSSTRLGDCNINSKCFRIGHVSQVAYGETHLKDSKSIFKLFLLGVFLLVFKNTKNCGFLEHTEQCEHADDKFLAHNSMRITKFSVHAQHA